MIAAKIQTQKDSRLILYFPCPSHSTRHFTNRWEFLVLLCFVLFFIKNVRFYQTLPASIEMMVWFSILICWWIMVIDFWILNIPCIAEMKLTWAWFFLSWSWTFSQKQLDICLDSFWQMTLSPRVAWVLGKSSELDKIKNSLSVASSKFLVS